MNDQADKVTRRRAVAAARRAYVRGEIDKTPCVVCGDWPSEGHHEDYSKPLDVIWLCRRHHVDRHREIDAGQPLNLLPWEEAQ